jgi:hypothetical protein
MQILLMDLDLNIVEQVALKCTPEFRVNHVCLRNCPMIVDVPERFVHVAGQNGRLWSVR